ncbi:hypothetical protein AQUCO_04000126v1 [Aquilegia coerulea]|uniref:DUF4408 domain-containing protein n=1 Tax=Aquilegia coerulea TaxID=218851 RepID=A0A2G5CRD3_AQUCA|nr:hypothetical protein AQUCO_04000126v1 [Aquilegia coerulea]
MDSIRIEKLQAMNKYKKSTQFLDNFILYCFTALTCSILCSSPFWLPSLYSSTKAFLFVSLPSIGVLFFNPKCLFILCNVIVIFLIGESKFVSSKSSPDTDEIYDEYVKRSASFRRQPNLEEKEVKETKLELCLVDQDNDHTEVVEEEEEVMEEKGDIAGQEEVEKKEDEEENEVQEENQENDNEKEEDLDGEEFGLPAEE